MKFTFMLNRNSKMIFVLFFIFLIHQLIFQKYLIFNNTYVAEDYKGYVPWMIFGKIWFMKNGLFHLPHFIPSMCGGIPYHADPSSFYLSFMQLLFINFSVPIALKSSFFIFSLSGYLGMFFLCKICFKFNNFTSLVAATIFIFNGFFTNRVLVGHLIYGYTAFIPLYAFLIIKSINNNKHVAILNMSFASLLLSSFFYAGSSSFMLFVIYSIMIILALYCFFFNFSTKIIFKKFFVSLILTFLLSFSKINYSLSFLELFPREIDPAIMTNYFSFIYTFFTSLFLVPDPFFFADHQLQTNKFYVSLHELEYGLSILPLLIISYYIFFIKKNIKVNKLPIFYLSIILIIPTLLIVDIPYLSNLINKLPIVSSTWVRTRWLSVYIIPIILVSSFLLNKIKFNKKAIMIGLLIIPICQNYFYIEAKSYFFPEKSFEKKAVYSIDKINNFSNYLDYETIDSVKIKYVKNNQNFTRMDMNEGFIINTSELFCYSPIFGYNLEKLPKQKITKNNDNYDEKLKIKNNQYNLFKPMCFLFPSVNNCAVGETFSFNEKEQLIKFSEYKIIKFQKSNIQIVADYTSIISLIVLISCTLVVLVLYFKKKTKIM